MKKVIVEYESKCRVNEKRPLEFDALTFSSEKIAKKSMASRNKPKDCAESYGTPPFSEKDSKQKTEPKLHEIIQIDDDEDGLTFISTSKRRQVSDETKSELTYTSLLFNNCRSESDSFIPILRSQEQRSDD